MKSKLKTGAVTELQTTRRDESSRDKIEHRCVMFQVNPRGETAVTNRFLPLVYNTTSRRKEP